MSSSTAEQVGSRIFAASARERLVNYLGARTKAIGATITALTPDASTREYFRVPWKRGTAIAAVYPEPFDPEFHPYLDVTRLFSAAHLPVPEVLDVDGQQGIIMQEDLGDRQLRVVLETASEDEREAYID